MIYTPEYQYSLKVKWEWRISKSWKSSEKTNELKSCCLSLEWRPFDRWAHLIPTCDVLTLSCTGTRRGFTHIQIGWDYHHCLQSYACLVRTSSRLKNAFLVEAWVGLSKKMMEFMRWMKVSCLLHPKFPREVYWVESNAFLIYSIPMLSIEWLWDRFSMIETCWFRLKTQGVLTLSILSLSLM